MEVGWKQDNGGMQAGWRRKVRWDEGRMEKQDAGGMKEGWRWNEKKDEHTKKSS